MTWNEIVSLRLRNAPRSIRCLAAGYVLALSLAYLYAIGNIALVVGLTPKDIAIHYYGSHTLIPEASAPTGEATLDLDKLEAPTESTEPGPRPTFKALVGEGHFHLFGMSSFFFALCLLALFTGLSETIKAWLIGGTFVLIVLDNVSFMATRFLGPKLAMLTAVSGGLMGLCFMALWGSVIWELFFAKNNLNSKEVI